MIAYDILICGIGGQGAISLGTVLKLAAIHEGLDVVGAERRGGAQREGIVTSNVRYRKPESGETPDERRMAASGLIPTGGADMMISMEPMEALRHARYLNERSVVIVNDFPLTPVSVRMGECAYPPLETIQARLREFTPNVHLFPIDELSRSHFNALRQVNTIALGMASALGDLPVSDESILAVVREQFSDFETNRRAFALGKDTARQ
ncbi:MAG TPA: indolepyruvate oxidoreductase subunit beta [Spirochaetota bacterium]|nr:indolepyruvate oxidoreductase subunit beta [Spirochaetota bacterium]